MSADELEVLRAQNEFLLNRLRAIRDNAAICLPDHMRETTGIPTDRCFHTFRTHGYDGPICQSCGQVLPEPTPEEVDQLCADIAEDPVPAEQDCPECHGRGDIYDSAWSLTGSNPVDCHVCGGTGTSPAPAVPDTADERRLADKLRGWATNVETLADHAIPSPNPQDAARALAAEMRRQSNILAAPTPVEGGEDR